MQFQVFSNPIRGVIFGIEAGQKVSLPGAALMLSGTNTGTISNDNGEFEIVWNDHNRKLVASFVGYVSDSIEWTNNQIIEIVLTKNQELEEVTVFQKNKGTYLSKINPIYTQIINSAELKKAACCNLSESFITNPSVDVSYTDAITGAKQIKLLGLDGAYSQLQTENFPNFRGLASNYGLLYVPGPWLESIQVSKGAASVVNGFESITGQINANFKKPDSPEKFHFNLFQSDEGKSEINSNVSFRLSDKTTSTFFLHGENFQTRKDHNQDGFIDDPMVKQIHLFNQWKYFDGRGFMIHAGVHYLKDDRTGGQTDYRNNIVQSVTNPYGVNINTERGEMYLKIGYDFKSLSHSLALISNATYHDMNSFYGLNKYSGKEYSFYANLIHTYTIDKDDQHVLNSGLSVIYDFSDEISNNSLANINNTISGIFTEYTFKPTEKLTLLTGIRTDLHEKFGAFITPRFHFRYSFTNDFNIRVSAGKGYRLPRIIAENSFLLANSRKLVFNETEILEKAWNYGVSLNKELKISNRILDITAEFYRTDFMNQMVVDRESSASNIIIGNLNGESFANSYQIEMRYELFNRLDMTAAFRINDVKQTINNQLLLKPLTSKYKGLIALNYIDKLKKWMFDYTAQFNGGGRIPIVNGDLNSDSDFPAYTVMNAQITKFFRTWDLYLGSENLLDFTQTHSVIGADKPFGSSFDATRIWGPIMGRKFYAGLRITINR